jgi:hypothetical protein
MVNISTIYRSSHQLVNLVLNEVRKAAGTIAEQCQQFVKIGGRQSCDRLSGLVGCKVFQVPRYSHVWDGIRRLAFPKGSAHSILQCWGTAKLERS